MEYLISLAHSSSCNSADEYRKLSVFPRYDSDLGVRATIRMMRSAMSSPTIIILFPLIKLSSEYLLIAVSTIFWSERIVCNPASSNWIGIYSLNLWGLHFVLQRHECFHPRIYLLNEIIWIFEFSHISLYSSSSRSIRQLPLYNHLHNVPWYTGYISYNHLGKSHYHSILDGEEDRHHQ